MTEKELKEILKNHERSVAFAKKKIEEKIDILRKIMSDVCVFEALVTIADKHECGWDEGYKNGVCDTVRTMMDMLRRGQLRRMDTNEDVISRLSRNRK